MNHSTRLLPSNVSTLIPLLLITLLGTSLAMAAGSMTKRAVRLEPLLIDANSGFSNQSITLETGVFYRWRISSDGRDEYKLLAPEFFSNSWVQQISIEDKEVKPMGLYAVEFDAEGDIDIFLIPIEPGVYPFYIEHLKTQGFNGEIIVK